MQNYQPLRKLGPGFWIRDGEWYGTSFRRRMTVMALKNGQLLVHNAFLLKESDLIELKALGEVAGIIMPNVFHGDDVGWMAEKFPSARVFVPARLQQKLHKKHRVDGSLENDWPSEWLSDVVCLPIEGLRILDESIFLHKESKTLVLTDLVFNMAPDDFKSTLERKMMALNRVGIGFGPSWLCDYLFTRDLSARLRSIQQILSWDFDRVVMNHGRVVEAGGKELMRRAFDEG